MAGGVTLNCVANGNPQGKNFERIWISTAAGDAGGALARRLAAWHAQEEIRVFHHRGRHASLICSGRDIPTTRSKRVCARTIAVISKA